MTKIITIVVVASLIFMGLSFYLAPNEGAKSKFTLQLAPHEKTMKPVNNHPGNYIIFEFWLDYEDGSFVGTHEITFGIANDTYFGPNADPTNWEFEFLLSTGGTYTLPEGTKLPFLIELKVIYQSIDAGEMVQFTLNALESAVGNEAEYEENYTYLTPLDCYGVEFEYLTVYSTGPFSPFWEPAECPDEIGYALSCIDPATYRIRIWNFGSMEDNVPITSWIMNFIEPPTTRSVQTTGVIDVSGNFIVTFSYPYPSGGTYNLGDDITLPPGESEEILVHIQAKGLMITGDYLLVIEIESEGSGNTYADALLAFYPPLNPIITNPKDGYYYRPGQIIHMSFTESTGAIIPEDNVVYYYDEGNGPIEIIDSDPTVPGVQWDTTGIPNVDCEYWTYSVDVWVEVTTEDCRHGGSDRITIFFCIENNPDPCLIIIDIRDGWNLVSIGVELDDLGGDYDAAAFAAEINAQAGEDIIKYVVRWNVTSGEYEEYIVTSGIGVNFPINEGEGYYIYSISPFEVEFFIVGDCPQDKTFDLLECWNLIGYRSTETVSVEVWAQMIEDHFGPQLLIQAIVRYDNVLKQYEAWYPGDGSSSTFMVKPGEAYWIFAATEILEVPFPNENIS